MIKKSLGNSTHHVVGTSFTIINNNNEIRYYLYKIYNIIKIIIHFYYRQNLGLNPTGKQKIHHLQNTFLYIDQKPY